MDHYPDTALGCPHVFYITEGGAISSPSPGKRLDYPWTPSFMLGQVKPPRELEIPANETGGEITMDLKAALEPGESAAVEVLHIRMTTKRDSTPESNVRLTITGNRNDLNATLGGTPNKITMSARMDLGSAGDNHDVYIVLVERPEDPAQVLKQSFLIAKTVGPSPGVNSSLDVVLSNISSGGGMTATVKAVFPGSARWEEFVALCG